MRGAEALLRSDAHGKMLACTKPLTTTAADVAARFEAIAEGLHTHRKPLHAPFGPPPAVVWPTHIGLALYHLADMRVWLEGLRDDLDRIEDAPKAPDAAAGLAALRQRVGGGRGRQFRLGSRRLLAVLGAKCALGRLISVVFRLNGSY